MKEINVILVDSCDREIGLMPKTEAHKKGLLHRAVSVFLINNRGEWLIQQRALNKYHSAGLWTNTCCSHPLPGESDIEAATRRLSEEMGLFCELTRIFSFTYHEIFDNDLQEHEIDHVFIGICNDMPKINPSEVLDFKYIKYKDLEKDVLENPEKYTIWFRKIYGQVNVHFQRFI